MCILCRSEVIVVEYYEQNYRHYTIKLVLITGIVNKYTHVVIVLLEQAICTRMYRQPDNQSNRVVRIPEI